LLLVLMLLSSPFSESFKLQLRFCVLISLLRPHIPVSVYIERGITLDMPQNPKIAFMFLTPGSLPFEKLWYNFFQVRIVLLPI